MVDAINHQLGGRENIIASVDIANNSGRRKGWGGGEVGGWGRNYTVLSSYTCNYWNSGSGIKILILMLDDPEKIQKFSEQNFWNSE